MVLIFGGAYQGKLDYAMKRFGLSKEDVFFCDDTEVAVPTGKKIVYEIDKWILALVKANKNIEEDINHFTERNPDAIVIANDISCGIVPVDRFTRQWREETGRAVGKIAQHSDEVARLFCGIPTKIK